MRDHPCFVVLAWASVIAAAAVGVSSQSGILKVERQGDHLRLSAPQLHFLEGQALERLRNGDAVTYILSVTVGAERGTVRWLRLETQFAFSYDLWEEKFSVVEARPPRRSASRLSAAMAEAWCVGNLLLAVASMPAEKTFVVKLECSVPEEDPPPGEGLTLSTLIDVFSRKRAAARLHWEVLSGPLRLADLKDRTRR